MDEFVTHFSRNPDGSWTCISAGTFSGPNGRIQVSPGSTFYRGTMFMGFDLAAWLDDELPEQSLQRPPHAVEGRRQGDRRRHDGEA